MDSKGKATNDDMEREQEQEQEQNPNYNMNNNGLGEGLQVDEEEIESNSVQQHQQREQQQASRTRTPFTTLSQVDADLALARTLQEQERAYMMLRMNNNEGSDYGSWETGSYLHDEDNDFGGDVDDDDASDADDQENHEYDGSGVLVDEDNDDDDEDEDAFDVHAHDEVEEDDNPSVEYDSDVFSSDEAYARALQDAEERDMAARLLAIAGINDRDREVEDPEDHSSHSQDRWEDVDPDNLSYEELLALGEIVGTESRGLSTDTIASLLTVNYKSGTSQNESNDSCVICRLDYEDDETLTVLSCKHSYHSECINNWLKINKVCPICSAEVSTSGHS